MADRRHLSVVPQTMPAGPAGFRAPPHDIQIEQVLLGSVLINNGAYREVSEFLRPEMFYEPVHGRIFAAMAKIIEDGRLADAFTLAATFDQDEALRELDGAKYLSDLSRFAETVMNARDYGLVVKDLACRRWLIQIGSDLTNSAYELGLPSEWPDISTNARRKIEDLEKLGVAEPWLSAEDVIERIALRVERPPVVWPSGLGPLDDAWGGGLKPRRCYGVEATAKSFKTGLLGSMILGLARRGTPTLYIAADRPSDEMFARVIAAELNMNARDLEGSCDHKLADRVRAVSERFRSSGLIMQDAPSLTLGKLKTICNQAVEVAGCKVIVLDYLQRVEGRESARENRVEGFERVVEWLKDFSFSREVAIVIASQENETGGTLWGGGLKRAVVWLGQLNKVEVKVHGWRSVEAIWIDVIYDTHGMGRSIGSDDQPAWLIGDVGPVLQPWAP